MHYESMKNEQIPMVTPKHKANLKNNLDVSKSTKHNRSLIRHNRSTIMSRSLSPTKTYAVKTRKRSFYDSK